jgi:hypothetical protein
MADYRMINPAGFTAVMPTIKHLPGLGGRPVNGFYHPVDGGGVSRVLFYRIHPGRFQADFRHKRQIEEKKSPSRFNP